MKTFFRKHILTFLFIAYFFFLGGAYPQSERNPPIRIVSEEKNPEFAQKILGLAKWAYDKIVFDYGFNRKNHAFIGPGNEVYTPYEKDGIIEIHLCEDIESPYAHLEHKGGLEYEATIFFPLDYKEYQEKAGIEDKDLDLKAALIHEISHIITYSYNQNFPNLKNWPWYYEGLALFFESLIGYEFKTKFDESVLLWKYIHEAHGMAVIEEVSAKFKWMSPKKSSRQEAEEIIAETVGKTRKEFLKDFKKWKKDLI